MLKEFKEFALRGNVVDLAIGVIIGVAFNAIVQSVVADLFMPVIGAVTGGLDFSNYFIALSGNVTADSLEEARKEGAVLRLGQFCHGGDQFSHRRLGTVSRRQAHQPFQAAGRGEGAARAAEAGSAARRNPRSVEAAQLG
jgi:hypothetical protein